MDIHYDPKVWDSVPMTSSTEFNVELDCVIDNIDYACQRRAKSSTTSDTNSDSTAVSWLSGLFSSLYSKPMASSTAVAHGFVEEEDDDDDDARRFSFQSLRTLHPSRIPPLSSHNFVHLSTPSLRYTKQCCPELPANETTGSMRNKKSLTLKYNLKLKLLSSPRLLDKLRSKFKTQWRRKRMRPFYKMDENRRSEDGDPVLYPEDPDPDPFARQFGPYRVALD